MPGCGREGGCAERIDEDAASKLRPMPIGLDLHSRFERSPLHEHPCAQARRLDALRAAAPAWADRTAVAAHFATTNAARKRLMRAVRSLPPRLTLLPEHNWVETQERQFARVAAQSSWLALSRASFVLCPVGRGVDTHRVWEALALGAVAVVVHSTLDVLYRDLPVVIVHSWRNLSVGEIERWRREVRSRFGHEPFSAIMQRRLTLPYWCGRIRNAAAHGW